MQIKVLSWNIWIDCYFEKVAQFLKSANADIIGLQEVLPNDPKRDVISLLKNLGYNHVFSPFEHSWGTKVFNDAPAIFTKFKIQKSDTHILSEKDARIAVRADIKVGDKTLHVFSTHLIHIHQQPSKVQEEQARTLIKNLPAENTIVMGDFNATPESSTIKNMRKVLVDSDPSSKPTWSMYEAGCKICYPGGVKIRLDYIFTSKDINISSFTVENSKGSDHLPISVVIEL